MTHFESAVPQFTVKDVVATAEYYRDVLGFTIAGYWNGEEVTVESDPPPVFGIVKRDEVRVHFSRAEGSPGGTGRAEDAYDCYFHITGVDAFAIGVKSRGAEILEGPADRVYGQREIVIRDPNGLILAFGESTSK